MAAPPNGGRADFLTPRDVFQRTNREFDFEFQICAFPHGAGTNQVLVTVAEALRRPWKGTCWMNPPYGADLGKWMRKAYREANRGATVVCLVPAVLHARWWRKWAERGEIRFLARGVQFDGQPAAPAVPAAIVIFRQFWWEKRLIARRCSWLGGVR